MIGIYGYLWIKPMGDSPIVDGKVTEVAIAWQRGLQGIPVPLIRLTLDKLAVETKAGDYPVNLPAFKAICFEECHLPTVEQCLTCLTRAYQLDSKANTMTVAQRFKHPLVFAIAKKVPRCDFNDTQKNGAVLVKNAYAELMAEGFADFEAHHFEMQKALPVKPVSSRERALMELAKIKKGSSQVEKSHTTANVLKAKTVDFSGLYGVLSDKYVVLDKMYSQLQIAKTSEDWAVVSRLESDIRQTLQGIRDVEMQLERNDTDNWQLFIDKRQAVGI